jgi:hypothetical protein
VKYTLYFSQSKEGMMPCDLERVYGSLAAQLPESPDSEPFALNESVLPLAPAELFSDKLRGFTSYHQRLPGCRGDCVDIIAPRSAFRHLGLLALAVLFHESSDKVTIHLTAPQSRLKHIVIQFAHSTGRVTGFRVRPRVLGYVPNEVSHTFSTHEVGFNAPVLRLTNIADVQRDEADWANRDTLNGIGGTYSTAEVAEFLLNFGSSNAAWKHVVIPPNGTFFTSEVRFWIPEQWEQLHTKLAEFSSRQRQP